MVKKFALYSLFVFLITFGVEWIAVSGDSEELKGSQYYRTILDQVLAHWPPQFSEPPQSDLKHRESPILAKAWETPGDEDYIGLQKKMMVSAPIETLDQIMSDFGHYVDLFPEFKEIKVIKQNSTEILTRWQRPIAFPFVPDVLYETAYQVDRSRPDRKVYRIQLRRSNRVWVSDDLVVIEKKGPALTQFSSFSFFEADWGPVRILGSGIIWKDSIEGAVLSDLSFKLRAEHPDWTPQKIQSERPKFLHDHFVDEVYDHRKVFALGELVPALKDFQPTVLLKSVRGAGPTSSPSPSRPASPSPSPLVITTPSPLPS